MGLKFRCLDWLRNLGLETSTNSARSPPQCPFGPKLSKGRASERHGNAYSLPRSFPSLARTGKGAAADGVHLEFAPSHDGAGGQGTFLLEHGPPRARPSPFPSVSHVWPTHLTLGHGGGMGARRDAFPVVTSVGPAGGQGRLARHAAGGRPVHGCVPGLHQEHRTRPVLCVLDSEFINLQLILIRCSL